MSTDLWTLRVGIDFERDVADLKKRHYKKNRRAGREYDRLLDELKSALTYAPLVDDLEQPKVRLKTKTYPKGHAVEDALFRNARFKMPGLDGSARHGRVYFDVHRESRTVRLLGAYTHAEHQDDLEERLLINRIKQEPLF